MRRRSLLLIAPAVCAVVGLSSGAAYAYLTSSGHGNGSASVGTMQNVTISSPTVSPGTPLRPGGSGDVSFEVSNPNNFTVTLVSVVGDGAIIPDSSHSATCTTTGVTFHDQTSLSILLPAGTTTVDLPGVATMDGTSSAGCQGATFSIPVTISVEK